ncbi:MAG: hypothetical protein AUI53_01280 [Acidobacteria bacterium 13_1_40CM_2_60_7]|nr:MAG: hypothetical protein AUI53_01280 [Acidobacteria bacterium 13_1_40CM_2_60_7]
MHRDSNAKLTRREWLSASALASGALLFGLDKLELPQAAASIQDDPFRGGRQLGVVPFIGEGRGEMETLLGEGLDGRLYTELSALAPENPVVPAEKFYVRTRASKLLDDTKPWTIRVGGLVKQPVVLSLSDLRKSAKPAGLHLLECSGNARLGHFGLLSAADWAGAPLTEILDQVKLDSRAARILISGFDRYPVPSATSIPGASWIFTLDEIKSAKAFLATEMNGKPLSRDHGAPVRYFMPGWYGCTCIKWVDEISFVAEDIPATSQMREFAFRTHQQGVPQLAKDYRPAFIEQAAMPIRVEKWLVDGKIRYRVVGILWGGSRLINALEIRFNPDEDYVAVDHFQQSANDPWSFWWHAWTPKNPGAYLIRLRVKDPPVAARRLDSGYYVRSLEITEV